MKPSHILATALCGVVASALAPAVAHAELHQIYTSGQWALYSGVQGNDPPVCAIAMSGAAGRRFTIQQFSGNPDLVLLVGKDSWSIPEHTPIDLALDIDGASVWRIHAEGSGTNVQGAIAFADSGPFETAFRSGRALRLSFPAGSEPPWIGNLNGSTAVYSAFNTCRSTMPRTAQTATPTQPFGGPPPATQPYATQPAAAPDTTPTAPNTPVATQPMGLPPIPQAPK